MKNIGKLVRDKIPQIITDSGKQCVFRVLDDSEIVYYLRKKLEEECREFMEDGSIDELADLLEVIESIAFRMNISWSELMNIKQNKARQNGAFAKKYFLVETET